MIAGGPVNAQAQAPSGKLDAAVSPLELPPSIRQQLASLPHGEKPKQSLATLKYELSTAGSTRPSQSRYELLDSGLVGVTTLLGGKGAIVSRVLTLSGMLEIASTTESTIEINLSNVLSTGTMIYSYRIHRTLRTNAVRNTTALSGDLASLMHPEAGARFSYVHSYEDEYTSSAALGSRRVAANTLNVTCNVAQPTDGSTLHPQLRGKYLPVVCEGTNREGGTFTNQFAFLLDSQIYLRLAAGNRRGETRYTLTGAEYAQ